MPFSWAIFFANGLANTLPPGATGVGGGEVGEAGVTGGGEGGADEAGGGGGDGAAAAAGLSSK